MEFSWPCGCKYWEKGSKTITKSCKKHAIIYPLKKAIEEIARYYEL